MDETKTQVMGDFDGTSAALEDISMTGKVAEDIQLEVQRRLAGETPPAPETEVVKEIDLGDGKGVQRFVGKSWQEVADKLGEAQRHATAKIRELSQRNVGIQPDNKALYQPVELKARDLTAAEMLRIQDQFGNNMQAGFDELIKARLGADPATIANSLGIVQQLYKNQMEQNASSNWVSKHAGEYWQFDLIPNLKAIAQKVMTSGYPVNENNLEWAYNQLVQAGDIMVEEPKEETPPPPPPPVSRQTPQPPTYISARSGQRVEQTPAKQGVDVEALNKLPLDQMKAAINRKFDEGRRNR